MGENSQAGVKKTDENSQFQFGNLKNLGGGLNFSKMSEFQLFDSVVCNFTFIRSFQKVLKFKKF